jgi:flagellar hook-associated protein FlgK
LEGEKLGISADNRGTNMRESIEKVNDQLPENLHKQIKDILDRLNNDKNYEMYTIEDKIGELNNISERTAELSEQIARSLRGVTGITQQNMQP